MVSRILCLPSSYLGYLRGINTFQTDIPDGYDILYGYPFQMNIYLAQKLHDNTSPCLKVGAVYSCWHVISCANSVGGCVFTPRQGGEATREMTATLLLVIAESADVLRQFAEGRVYWQARKRDVYGSEPKFGAAVTARYRCGIRPMDASPNPEYFECNSSLFACSRR